MANEVKIWVDDIRPAPEGYVHCYTTNEAKMVIQNIEALKAIMCHNNLPSITLLDLDHDAGDYVKYGGDYIEILNWLEKQGYNIPIRLHTMNPVGCENMRRIIWRNDWKEVNYVN